MTKLIKLNNHFYVIDDYIIEENDYFVNNNEILKAVSKSAIKLPKVTHSTDKLEGVIQLNLSDVEEVVYGYSVEKLAEKNTLLIIQTMYLILII